MRVDLSTLCLLIVSFGSLRATDDEPAKAHVAIVGAGIAGISTAYWLKYYLNDSIAITIYENDRVGGRLETVGIDGVEYEAGGSIIHEKNLYMKRFTEELGLKPIESESSGAYFMTDNGENVLFSTLSKYIPKVFLLLWRYRFDAIRLKFWLGGKLSNFIRIYDYQDNGRTFDTVEEFLKLLDEDFYTSTRMSFRKYLFEKGFHKDFINELAQVAALVNYDQSVDTMNGFPGLVSLMAADSSLWHVEGGNKLVPKKLLEKLLQLPNVQFVQGHVKSVEEIHRRADDDDQGGAIRLAFQPANSELVHSVSYDSVILAFPLHRDNVDDFHLAANEQFQQENFRMQPTHANFVHGQYNCSAYGLTVDECARLKAIFFINPSFPFRSVAEQQSTVAAIKPTKKDQRAIYKVFSPGPLSSDHFQRIFDRTNYELVQDFPWLAYPRYNYPQKFPPIKLQKNLFYVNAMEWSASCMEIEAISARNIALLITKELGVKIKRTDKHSEF